MSDNASTPIGAPQAYGGGSKCPFRGELGDVLEGLLPVSGMIRWPGTIAPRASNAMVSIHDVFPTLAKIIGAELPTDRPYDGLDQSDFFLGQQPKSTRE
jgi:arylsulfatase